MKVKTLIISAAFMLMAAGTGIGFYLYAKMQSADTDAARTEQVFKYFTSPPEESCTAYAFQEINSTTGEYYYVVSTSPDYGTILVESREGYVMDCVTCISRCSAFYELCGEYGIELEENY